MEVCYGLYIDQHVFLVPLLALCMIALSTLKASQSPKTILPEKDVPSVTRLSNMSCSSLFFGNAGCVDAQGGPFGVMASHSLQFLRSVRTTACRFGARFRIALRNVSCCSSGLKPAI